MSVLLLSLSRPAVLRLLLLAGPQLGLTPPATPSATPAAISLLTQDTGRRWRVVAEADRLLKADCLLSSSLLYNCSESADIIEQV